MNPLPLPSPNAASCAACLMRRLQSAQRHWLLDSLYGRELLKKELRRRMPELHISDWREHRELDPLLDLLLDELALRGWEKPRTVRQRVKYVLTALRLTSEIHAARSSRLKASST